MARDVEIRAGDAMAYLVRLKKTLEDPEPLRKMLGALVVAQAQRAFREEAFDGEKWLERYPNQQDPVVNLAGVVADLSRGLDTPKPHRFERRPVGKDEGDLWQSISDRQTSVRTPGRYVVEVGSVVEHASRYQFGGVHSQPVSEGTKARIATFIESPAGAPFWKKLFFLTRDDVTELDTDLIPRPYLGITKALKAKIVAATETELEELKPERG